MPYYLIQNNTEFQQNTQIHTIPNYPFYGSIEKPIKGKWYLEITHNSGTHQHVCGFNFDKSAQISFYGNGDSGSQIYFLRTKDSESSESNNIPFSISGTYTLGLSIDIEKNLFTVYHNLATFSKNYEITRPVTKLNVHFREITSSGASDYLSVNLGDHPFLYDIPYGYIPWSKYAFVYSCRLISFSLSLLPNLIFIFLLK